MKKIILSVAAVFAFGFANAQDKKESSEGFAKGDVFVTGSFGFSSDKYTDAGNYKEDSFEFKPSAAYFVSENIALGAGFGIGSTKVQATESGTAVKVNSFNAGLFGRYYFTPSSKFSLFGHLGFDYTSSKPDTNNAVKTTGFDIALRPGINYFVSSNFSLEATFGAVGFSSSKVDTSGAKASTGFDFGLDLTNIGLGLNYKF